MKNEHEHELFDLQEDMPLGDDQFRVSTVLGLSPERTQELSVELCRLVAETNEVIDIIKTFAHSHNGEAVMRGLMIAWYLDQNERVTAI